MGRASGNAPGSGTAELTMLEIRPVYTTTRSRAGGAGAIETPLPGAIETPMPGAVPDFIPVVGRYRTIATWRLSFHCGMKPRRLIAVTNQPMRVMLGLQPRRSRAAKI